MERMMKSELFTLQEILNHYPSFAPTNPCQSSLDGEWFTKILNAAGLKYQRYALSSDITDNLIKAIVNSLITNVYDRHANDYIYRVDSLAISPDYVLDEYDYKKALIKIINVINLTMPRYLPILQSYKTASNDPVAPIKSKTTGESKFNDTPQNIGDYGDEDHTTNITNSMSESEIDTGSIMERLEATFKNYRSIILDWSNEFNQLFFKEEQFYE